MSSGTNETLPQGNKSNGNRRQREPVSRSVRISKLLSKLLRHQAESEGLSIDSEGFIKLSDVMKHKYLKSVKATYDEVFEIVNNNDKKRFKIINKSGDNDDDDDECTQFSPQFSEYYYISALQGHSINKIEKTFNMVEFTADDVDFPKEIIHGTFKKNLELILKSGGLSKMKRNHIHFTSGLPEWLIELRRKPRPSSNSEDNNNKDNDNNNKDGEKIISGMRKTCNVLIYLDVEKLKNSEKEDNNDDKLKFYKSDNGVILSPGDANGFINKKYFKKITDQYGTEITGI
ncbi:hypothetical protein B5S30_g5202 [[Candida] boidinii]|nr:hypothetical protein B5S30_g5202 [[Candida] boidinii]GMG13311.1 unnamed protein product [[Candida] boidinii]